MGVITAPMSTAPLFNLRINRVRMLQAIYVYNRSGNRRPDFGKCYTEERISELHRHPIGVGSSADMEDLCSLSYTHHHYRQGKESCFCS